MKNKILNKAAVLMAAGMTGAQAFALDAASNTAITAATDSGADSVQLVVTGVIAIAAVVTAVGVVLGLLRK